MTPSKPDSEGDDPLARRAEELQMLRQIEEDTTLSGDQREVSGELSIVSQHPADVADFTYQREMQETTRQLLNRETEQVEAALRARSSGKYGICKACGNQIPPERLG